MTNETLIKAIKDSKAITISGLWKHLGHKSAISGSQSKKIREMVPNLQELLDANKGTPIVAPAKTETITPQEKAKREKIYGFYVDKQYGALVKEASKGFVNRHELVAKVAKMFKTEERLVAIKYYVLDNKKGHKTNNGRVRVEHDKQNKDMVMIVPTNPA